VVIRPWLQAFAWRTKTYSPQYVEVQVATSKQKGGVGFLFWNANNDYSKPYAAMPEMRAAAGKYFRGDEVGVKTEAVVNNSPLPSSAGDGAAAPLKSNGGGQVESVDPHKAPTMWRH
jgi:hypothetical protein